jgi:hypothetical protein
MVIMTKKYNFRYVCLTDTWGERPHNEGGFCLDWAEKDIGFGRLSFIKYLDVDNPDVTKTICETECMPRDFIEAAVEFWIKSQVKLVDK